MDWLTGLNPAWITALAASAALVFTGLNLRQSRLSFKADAWQRKISQARLVWGVAVRSEGRTEGSPANPAHAEGTVFARRTLGVRPGDHRRGKVGAGFGTVMARDATLVAVQVSNSSDAPISRVRVELSLKNLWNGTGRRPEGYPSRVTGATRRDDIKVLLPGSSATFVVLVRTLARRKRLRGAVVTINFTDSAGVRWSRKGTDAPVEVTAASQAGGRGLVKDVWGDVLGWASARQGQRLAVGHPAVKVLRPAGHRR